jgi:hypothetical protein
MVVEVVMSLWYQEKDKKKIVNFTYLYVLALFVMAFILSIISNVLIDIFVDEKFLGAR